MMKAVTLFLIFLFSDTTGLFSMELPLVYLSVDVLGKKNETVRYYHPVEGAYRINLSSYENNKSIAEAFRGCVFIDPRNKLDDSVNNVLANILRYYIDPNELIYIDWELDSDTSNVQMANQIKAKARETFNKKYQVLVDSYFKPFYLKKTEVTNREYREFVFWVRDSLFKEKIYRSEEFSPEEVFSMLSIPKRTKYFSVEDSSWTVPDPRDIDQNRKRYCFRQDFDIWEEFDHERLLKVLYDFYLHPNERWYKRREIDVTKLVYSWCPGDSVYEQSVYPDTLCWVRDSRYFFNDPFTNMCFWHPAFANFPVVGVSYKQAEAFCHWKEQQIFAENPELRGKFVLNLPGIMDYERAINDPYNFWESLILSDDQLLSNLLVDASFGEFGKFHELLQQGISPPLQKVFDGFDEKSTHAVRQFNANQKRRIKNGSYNDILYQELIYMRCSQNFLRGEIFYLSNNVSEWLSESFEGNYRDLFKAYINYHCYSSIDYCEHQRIIDQNLVSRNDTTGQLILGGNWFDERYESILGVNVGGLYPKAFRNKDKTYSTVGFRYVIRPVE